mmetsp:Transcript_53720/g.105056  ORF Transcript_53720/g.105056 Transcript_53720/m.105056 type:complete len:147 (-) Transcript_53720:1152-1592(-)
MFFFFMSILRIQLSLSSLLPQMSQPKWTRRNPKFRLLICGQREKTGDKKETKRKGKNGRGLARGLRALTAETHEQVPPSLIPRSTQNCQVACVTHPMGGNAVPEGGCTLARARLFVWGSRLLSAGSWGLNRRGDDGSLRRPLTNSE